MSFVTTGALIQETHPALGMEKLGVRSSGLISSEQETRKAALFNHSNHFQTLSGWVWGVRVFIMSVCLNPQNIFFEKAWC